jgi:AcrR family transcriptional regulator
MDATKSSAMRAAGSGSQSATPAERLLAAATELFATQGIRAIGIDRLLRDSGVAKASLYSAYGSKDGLVIAYLRGLDQADRNRWIDATDGMESPRDRLLTFFDLALAGGLSRNFRGCQYSNSATEFPELELEPVTAHRQWVRETLVELLDAIGVRDPATAAADIQLIYDGALAGSKLERSVRPIELGRRLADDVIERGVRQRS